jgi:hypothetical protein
MSPPLTSALLDCTFSENGNALVATRDRKTPPVHDPTGCFK